MLYWEKRIERTCLVQEGTKGTSKITLDNLNKEYWEDIKKEQRSEQVHDFEKKNLSPKEPVLYKKKQKEHLRYDLEGTMLIMLRFVKYKDDKLYNIGKHKDDQWWLDNLNKGCCEDS